MPGATRCAQGGCRGDCRRATPGWQDAVDWWSKLAHGGRADANATVDRFNAQARDWYGQMQQVAAQFAGQHASAADIAAEWKRALGAHRREPVSRDVPRDAGAGRAGVRAMDRGRQRHGSTHGAAKARRSLGMPAFGIGREHQERLQKLMQAQLDFQQREGAYNALMMKALQRAYGVFQDKLAEREEPGRQLTSARALFDLWIDAAEEAYAQIALSPEFREVYGAYVNAQMRLRKGMQGEIEQVCAAIGMPTRTEVDAAHRKIAELERVLRRMRDAAKALAMLRIPNRGQPPAPSLRPRRNPLPSARLSARRRPQRSPRRRPRGSADMQGPINFTPQGLAQEATQAQAKLAAGLETLRKVDDVNYGATAKRGSLARRQGGAVPLHRRDALRRRRCRC